MEADSWLPMCNVPGHVSTLFQCGEFVLASGVQSSFKIECDALTDDDLACLAELLSERLPPFGSVEGVPRGGLRLAELMAFYITDGPLLVVDDVWTTGVSMLNHLYPRYGIGAVIFARAETPEWVTPLFTMTKPL